MRALGLLGHPAFPLVLLGLLAGWATALALLVALAPVAPDWATGLLSFCGYDVERGYARAHTFLSQIGQAYVVGLLITWLYWSELRRRLSSPAAARALGAFVLAPLLAVGGAVGSGRVAFAERVDDLLVRGSAPAPAFALVDQRGHPTSLASLRGKVLVTTFFYAHCYDTCPTLLRNVQSVLERLPADGPGRDLVGLGITVDPARDQPAALAALVEGWRLDAERFRLLTGEPATVESALDRFGIYRRATGNGLVQHSNVILLIDREGRQGYAVDGVSPDLAALTRAAASLLAEAAHSDARRE